MVNKINEKVLTWLLLAGSVFVSCFVWVGHATDPVNAPKLFVIGTFSFGLLSLIVNFGIRILWYSHRVMTVLVIGFFLACINSIISSRAPWQQTIYGVYGRNSGFLLYFSAAMFLLGSLLLSHKESHGKLLNGLLIAGGVNIVYCLWVLSFGDPVPWNNTYKNILGLFGNPDFISAFLGIFISAATAKLLAQSSTLIMKVLLGSGVTLAAFEIYKSHSIQGIFVTLGGLALVIFFYLRGKFKSNIVPNFYAFIALAGGALAVLGMFQHGPLNFIYKKSVSLRGSYWKAGLKMGQDHPFSGVGLDTYGDWYRSARPPVALIDTPGPTVHSNVAHNVVIDLFASGGFPLLGFYLAIITVTLISIVRIAKRSRTYDPIFVGLMSAWFGYQAQSVISINQIGLAVWGWLLSGSLIGYEHITKKSDLFEAPVEKTRISPKSRVKNDVFSPQLIAGLGMVMGSLISIPPMSADIKWFNSLQTKDLATFEIALQSSYLNPLNSSRLANASMTLLQSNFPDQAKKYALRGIKFNPDSFESYFVLYGLPNATVEEKQMALGNMKRLDPNNPDVLHY